MRAALQDYERGTLISVQEQLHSAMKRCRGLSIIYLEHKPFLLLILYNSPSVYVSLLLNASFSAAAI